MTEHSVETLAYAAGLLDGEGCICIARHQPNERNTRVNPTYYLTVRIANTNKVVLEDIHNIFAGALNVHSRKVHPNRRPIWVWSIQGKQANAFLCLISPYLKIKQAQAVLAMEFHSYHKSHTRNINQITIETEERYRQQLQAMNTTTKPPEHTIVTSDSQEIILAYIAGLFDGEGHIAIKMQRPGKPSGHGIRQWPGHVLTAGMAITEKSIVEWMQSLFSGFVTSHSEDNKRQIWIWRVSTNGAQYFLKQIAPYLKIKKQQAVLAIAFQDYHTSHDCQNQIYRTQEVLAQKETYRVQISNLNLYDNHVIKGIEEYLSL